MVDGRGVESETVRLTEDDCVDIKPPVTLARTGNKINGASFSRHLFFSLDLIF